MTSIIYNNGETWLICGGCNFSNQQIFDEVMSFMLKRNGCPDKIVHGGASGADTMAARWAHGMAIEAIECRARRKNAGPMRNEEMLAWYKPERLIAFPGGKGTEDMVGRAKKAVEDIEVVEVKPK